MISEDDQVFLMAQQALMVKSPRSAATTVSSVVFNFCSLLWQLSAMKSCCLQ